MLVFLTGASGWIGSALVPELLGAGHRVLGLARSDASIEAVAALGADVHRGSLDDLESLRSGAAAADAVVHLGYNHDFSRMEDAARTDRDAIAAFGGVLEGSGRPLVIAAGVAGLATGRPATERDVPDPDVHPRAASEPAALAWAERDVRAMVVRFPPTVHGPGDHGFVASLVDIARATGTSGYVGEGANRWSAVHRLDAARLVRLALEGAPAGSVLHGIADEGVPTRAIAEALGRGLDLPAESVPTSRASEHFDWLGRFFGADLPASSTLTRERLGWQPTQPGLLADLEADSYFRAPADR